MTRMTDQKLRGFELRHDPRFNKGTALPAMGMAVAEQVTDDNPCAGQIYPPASHIPEGSLHVAERVATYIFDTCLARAPRPRDIGAYVRERSYRPVYSE